MENVPGDIGACHHERVIPQSSAISAMTSTTPTMKAVLLGTTRRSELSGRRLMGRIKAQQVLKVIA